MRHFVFELNIMTITLTKIVGVIFCEKFWRNRYINWRNCNIFLVLNKI